MSRVRYCGLFALLLTALASFAQIQADPIYTVKTGRELATFGVAAIPIGGSLLLQRRHRVLTPEDIENLDPARIPAIDRAVVKNFSKPAHQISNAVLFSSYALPATLLAGATGRDYGGKIALFSLQTLLLTNGLTNLSKHWARRARPYVYNPDVPMTLKTKPNANLSFFSGHTSNVACMYFLTATMHNDLYDDSRSKAVVWTTAAVVPAIQGYLRVKAGKHFITDVLAGYAVGALVGILVPALHR